MFCYILILLLIGGWIFFPVWFDVLCGFLKAKKKKRINETRGTVKISVHNVNGIQSWYCGIIRSMVNTTFPLHMLKKIQFFKTLFQFKWNSIHLAWYQLNFRLITLFSYHRLTACRSWSETLHLMDEILFATNW